MLFVKTNAYTYYDNELKQTFTGSVFLDSRLRGNDNRGVFKRRGNMSTG